MKTIDAVRTALAGRLHVEGSDGDQLITLPLAFSTGNLIQVRIQRIDADRWLVSDRGVTAGELAMAGVDLDGRQSASDSWTALAAQMRLDAALLQEVDRYELAGVTTRENLGKAVLAVGETALRGEMLRVLAPGYRARSLRDKVIALAGDRDFAVVPNAPMPTRHGGSRAVTVRIETNRPVYVQAVSGKKSALDGFDKAQAMFSSAEVGKEQLLAVIADPVQLEAWQRETLQESGQMVQEGDFDAYLDRLAAA